MVKCIVSFVFLLALTVVLASVHAQSNPVDSIYVCRDPQIETIRLEFRNLPDGAFVDLEPSWSYIAAGSELRGNVLVTDALEEATTEYPVGTAVIFSGDQTFSVIGDANSPLCSDQPESTPEPAAQQTQPVQEVMSTGRTCVAMYTPSGVVLVCS
jgi:hypothetical protein